MYENVCVYVCIGLIAPWYLRISRNEPYSKYSKGNATARAQQLLVFCFDVKIIANYFLIIYYWLSKHCLRLISSSRLSHYTSSDSRIYLTSYQRHCLLESGTMMHHVVTCMCTCPFLLHNVVFIFNTDFIVVNSFLIFHGFTNCMIDTKNHVFYCNQLRFS